jgi:hypothetical protein
MYTIACDKKSDCSCMCVKNAALVSSVRLSAKTNKSGRVYKIRE